MDQEQSLVQFLNLLPLSMNYGEWLIQARGALRSLFPQADITHILLNPHVDLFVRRDTTSRSAFIAQTTATSEGEVKKPAMHVTDRKYTSLEDGTLSILMKEHNRSIKEFHPPVIFPLYIHGDVHFASITLLFSKHRLNNGEQAEAELEKLRPFLTFCFTDAVARQQLGRPERMAIKSAIDDIRDRYKLSHREYQVLMLYIFSDSHDSIAESLNLSPTTVASHLKSIRSKTGTSSRGELNRLIGFPSADPPSL